MGVGNIIIAGGAIVGVGVLYFAAAIADRLFGQTMNGAQYGPNRTTIIERALKIIGAVAILGAIVYLASPSI